MKQLQFYISKIDSNLLKSIGGRPGELIHLLKTNQFLSEEALAEQLFSGNWSRQNYLNLKQRTRRILEAFFLVNPTKKGNEVLGKMQRCRKLYHLSMSLIEQAKRGDAKKMLEEGYNIARVYGFTQLGYNCSLELMIDASLRGKKSRYELYREQKNSLLHDLQSESLVQDFYYQIALRVNKKRGVIEEYFFNEMMTELDRHHCTTTRYVQFYYMIVIFYNLNTRDYKAVKKSSQLALEILRNRKGVYRSVLQFFAKNKALGHLAHREYSVCRKLLLEAEQYSENHSFNLGILHYYQALNELHSEEYNRAYELYRIHRKTKYEVLREQWKVMGAYLYFLKKVGRLSTGVDRFSVGKYLNETAKSSSDKTGNNINILIGELLIYLVKNKGKFIDRIESINQYSYYHLKNSDTQRARWFIRILCTLPRANFSAAGMERLASRQIDNLFKYPISVGDNLSIEIIPFEKLIELIWERLKEKVA